MFSMTENFSPHKHASFRGAILASRATSALFLALIALDELCDIVFGRLQDLGSKGFSFAIVPLQCCFFLDCGMFQSIPVSVRKHRLPKAASMSTKAGSPQKELTCCEQLPRKEA
jgi:hypothetical protein